MKVHVLRLLPGEDLRGTLEATFAQIAQVEGISAACIVSAVGSLSHATLRFAARPDGTEIPGPLELLMLSGTLSANGAHLHASLADGHGMMTGGHLMPGCVVRTTAEVVIALLPGWEFRRELDEATGFRELEARPSPQPSPSGRGGQEGSGG